MKTIGVSELAALLHRSEDTIKSDVNRRPETLPPRIKIPGSKKLIWDEADVINWINLHKEN